MGDVLKAVAAVTLLASCVAVPGDTVTGAVGTYAITPPEGCAMRPEGSNMICTLPQGGLTGGVELGVVSERWEPQQVASYTKSDWEDWMLAHQFLGLLSAGIEIVEGRHVEEDAIAARIGAETCTSLYGHLQAATATVEADDAAMTCIFADPETGRVDMVGVDYSELRVNPSRENDGFAERAAPVLHSLRRDSVS